MPFKVKKIRKRIQRPVEASAIYLLMFFVKCLTLRGARRVGRILGSIAYHIPSIKKVIKANLNIAFPKQSKKENRKVGIQSMGSLFNVFIEFIWFKGREDKIKNYVEFDDKNISSFQQNRAHKKPCILLTMHMGNWEITAQNHYNITDDTLTSVARKIKNPALEKLMYEGRTSTGAKITHEKGAVKALVQSLRKGQSIGLLVDQNTKINQGGVYGDFFGLPATISRSPATFAKKFDPDIYMVECYRTAKGFFIDYKELPFSYEQCGTEDDFSQALLKYMEQLVRARPDQWIWNYTRWGLCPEAELLDNYPFYAQLDRRVNR